MAKPPKPFGRWDTDPVLRTIKRLSLACLLVALCKINLLVGVLFGIFLFIRTCQKAVRARKLAGEPWRIRWW